VLGPNLEERYGESDEPGNKWDGIDLLDFSVGDEDDKIQDLVKFYYLLEPLL